eukprot:TRINITY_DN905_c0_g1_i1.p1 TRINITY_DN905_c0_g1~~TRINITY_DN905_c0_g1_i1.p1  ORF type:complete len:234 (+),score=53.69 TRINITY_DN905_c0_g1_i1:25-702(+)
MAAIQDTITKSQREIDELKLQIVKSPEKIKDKTQQVEKLLQHKSQVITGLEKQKSECEIRLKYLNKAEAEIQIYLSLTGEALQFSTKLKEAREIFKQGTRSLSVTQQLIRELNCDIKQAKITLDNHKEAIQRMEETILPETKEYKNLLEEITNKFNNFDVSQYEFIDKINKMEAEKTQNIQYTEMLRKEYMQCIQQMNQYQNMLMSDIKLYAAKLRSVMSLENDI